MLITGHTGFKGSWAALLLGALGAKVSGYSLAPDSPDGIFEMARIGTELDHHIGDVRDLDAMLELFRAVRPQTVIHMAAQALVRRSYGTPVETYATNVMGTVNLLEAVRQTPSVEAVVVVTSDKCYENDEAAHPFRETDPMGGHDPYSNSKGCAELVTDAYRRSFFGTPGATRIGSARAGNVIGGGDRALDRLVPDAMRAFSTDKALAIRNPASVRPWQHVLDPVLAYLRLAEFLTQRGTEYAEAWNFGPAPASAVPVEQIVDALVRLWGDTARWERDGDAHVHEAVMLRLDCSKAAERLGWHPLIGLEQALGLTVDWYRAADEGQDMRLFSLQQIEAVLSQAGVSRRDSAASIDPAPTKELT